MGSENDRRVLLAIVLSLAVYYLWVAFFAPPPEPVEEAPAEVAQVAAPPGPAPAVPVASPAVAEVSVPTRSEGLQSETWRGLLSSQSGGLGDLTLLDHTSSPTTSPVWTWVFDKVTGKSPGPWSAYQGGDDAKRLLGDQGVLGLAGAGALGPDGPYLVEAAGKGWTASRTLPSGLRITKSWQPGEDPHTLQVQVRFDNQTGQAQDRLWVGVVDQMEGDAGRFGAAFRPQAVVDGDVEHVQDVSDLQGEELERFEGPVSWFGVGDRYFMAVLAPETPIIGAVVVDTLPDGRSGAFLVDAAPLAPGESRTYSYLAWLGQKDLDLLQPLGRDLDEAVEFGIFGFFSKVLLFLLKVFQKGVVNWGLAIIALTVLVKVVFFPLTQKAFVSGKRMQAIQPKLKELQEKYKDNKELQSTETMKLFKEQGVNPMGGCLPTLIQLPVWFALYNVMLYSVELYDSRFLYLKDLTAPDPYGVLPVIYAVLIVAQQQMTPMGSLDPTQQQIMKMMPLIFAFMMFGFPSGLVLYFSVNILLTIFQQWLVNRVYDGQQKQAAAP